MAKLHWREYIWYKTLRRPYRLHVEDKAGSGPVIIFLHGIASSSDNWKLLFPLLKADYHCISIDLLGFGKSPKPQWYGYTMDDHLRMIHSAIRRRRLKQPFVLVGHSMGSLLATRYSCMYPDAVSRLLLLSPPVYAPLDTIKNRAARSRTALYLAGYKFLRTHKRATPDNVMRLRRLIPQAKFVELTRQNWIPFTRSLEHCIEQQTLIDDIARLKLPIDVFYGVFDEVVVAYNVRQLGRIAGVRLHQLRVNHVVGKRYAKAVAAVISAPSSDEIVTKITTSAQPVARYNGSIST